MTITHRFAFFISMCFIAGGSFADESGEQIISHTVSVGLTPHALAAVGFDGSSTQALLLRIEAAETLRQDLSNAQVHVSAVASQAAAAKSALQAHPGNAQAVRELAAADESLRLAHDRVEGARRVLRSAAFEGLSRDLETLLRRAIAQQSHQVMTELSVVGRSDDEWTTLNRDLRAFARHERLGTNPPAEVSRRVTDTLADARVVEARFYIQQNLAAIDGVFEATRDR